MMAMVTSRKGLIHTIKTNRTKATTTNTRSILSNMAEMDIMTSRESTWHFTDVLDIDNSSVATTMRIPTININKMEATMMGNPMRLTRMNTMISTTIKVLQLLVSMRQTLPTGTSQGPNVVVTIPKKIRRPSATSL